MNLMVGYDGSRSSRSALDLAVSYAKAFTGKLLVIASMSKGTEAINDQIKAMEQDLEKVKGRLENENIPCETHLLIHGMTPGEDLLTYAEEKGIDKIIIGIRRRSKVGKLVFGSNAQYIILHAPCPVTTVK